MELKKLKISGKEVEFVNQYRNTRMGFAHDTTLFINGCQRGTATCHYYNRTWESYRFQTVMLTVIYNLQKEHRKYLIEQFKKERGYQKMTPTREKEFNELYHKDQELALYNKIHNALCK